MSEKTEPAAKAIRKLKRRPANEQLATEAKFSGRPRSAEQLGHDRPVNKEAVKDQFGRLDWDDSFDYKKERSRD